MKKLIAAALSLALAGAMALPAFAALSGPAPEHDPQPGYALHIDGEDAGVRACVMVPLRAVAEKLGFTVTWNGDGTIFMDDGAMHTTVTIGEDSYQVTTSNPDLVGMSAPFSLGVPPYVVNGVTYVPLGLFDALLGSQQGAVTMEGSVISLDTDPLGRKGGEQIPNPFVEYRTLTDAAAAAGFDISVPDTANGSDSRVFQAIRGELLEVIYSKNGMETARIRKAAGTGDISGDYTQYAQIKAENGVTMKGENDLIMVAIWEKNGYTYSVSAEGGLSASAMAALIRTVK